MCEVTVSRLNSSFHESTFLLQLSKKKMNKGKRKHPRLKPWLCSDDFKCFNNFINEVCQMKCDVIINSAYSNDRKNPNNQIIIFHSSTMHSQNLTLGNTTTLPIYPDTFQRLKQKSTKKFFYEKIQKQYSVFLIFYSPVNKQAHMHHYSMYALRASKTTKTLATYQNL